MENKRLAACVYTDGSADNIKKEFGWGAHGYIYDADDNKGATKNKPSSYTVSNIGYLEPGEVKLYPHKVVDPIQYIDFYGAYKESGTNNIGEVLGFVETAIKLLDMNVKDILLYTDSTYTIHVIEESNKKTLNEIKSTIDVNTDLWILAKTMHEHANNLNATITYKKIKAHTGHLGNETADDLALLGRIESVRSDKTYIEYGVRDSKSYWKPKYLRHPFLNYKQIFFTINEAVPEDGSMSYSMLTYKEENEIGKKMHVASYGYAELTKKDEYVESVKDYFKHIMMPHSVVSTVRMDNLFKPHIFKYIERYGSKPLTLHTKNKKVITLLKSDTDPICNAINPPALAYQALDNVAILKMILTDYKKIKFIPNHNSAKEFIDITDLYYTKNNKDKTIIKPELTNLVKHIKYDYEKDGKKADIILQFGKDIISRNQLKKLEGLKPKIYLVVLNSKNIKIDYYTLIDLEETDDMSVWSNYYSNTVFLK